MNMRILKTFVPFLLALMAFSACDTKQEAIDDNNQRQGGEVPTDGSPYLYLGTDQFTFSGGGGSATLEITSNTDWKAEAADSWCTVSPASGSGSATVTISAEKNPSKEEERSTKILVYFNNLTVTAKVQQGLNQEDPVFSIDPSGVTVPGGGGEFTLTVISDTQEYEITIVDSWITEVSRSGDRHTGETVTFLAEGNEEDESRSGVVSVCTEGGSCIPVMVTQEPRNKFYAHSNLAMRYTAVWCQWCPYMDEAFHLVADEDDSFIFMTIHASEGYDLYYEDASALTKAYKVQGFPTGVLNGWQSIDNYTQPSTTASVTIQAMEEFEASFNCVAGIGISSSVSDGAITVSATVETGVCDTFKVAAFVLESGVVATQTYRTPEGSVKQVTDFVHDNVTRRKLTEEVLGDEFTSTALEANEFTWTAELDSSWDTSNLSVLVYVYRDYGDKADYKAVRLYPDYYIVNAAIAPAGESVGIEYAE